MRHELSGLCLFFAMIDLLATVVIEKMQCLAWGGWYFFSFLLMLKSIQEPKEFFLYLLF